MRGRLVTVLVLSACTPVAGGLGPDSAATSGSTSGDGTTVAPADTTSAPEPTGGMTSTMSGGEESSSSGPSSSSSSSSSGGSDTTGGPSLPASCNEILMLDPAAPTGIHTIARLDNGMPIDVHCEMELDGGGWTLIARSEAQASGDPFGWKQSTGTVGDATNPYSLGVATVGPEFTEVLLTRRTGFATPTANAYVLEVPPGFIEDYGDSTVEGAGLRTVLGGCDPPGGPNMLRWIGFTNKDDVYFLRDFGDDILDFGLFQNRFNLYYDDCNLGASLNDYQGAIFVR